ncbi:protein ENHANCED DISEASE RESISTANCE 2 isoform X5 [Glycine max]|nr:protein ENHANCED DISEASE RESISTANCE 2 isoform X5 [Glycine max]
MQIDLKEGWGVGYLSSFQQYCVRQMLNSVAGLREWFAQSDERNAHPRIPVMVNLSSTAVSSKKNQKPNDFSINPTSLDQMNATSRSSALIDEYFDDEEDFQIAEPEQEAYQIGLENDVRKTALEEEPAHEIDFSSFSGNLRRDDRDNARDCWKISDGNNFKVRSKHYCYEKTKKVPAGKHMLDLVAVDWFIDSKRMDHVARRHGCAAQVASEKGFFSIVLNLQWFSRSRSWRGHIEQRNSEETKHRICVTSNGEGLQEVNGQQHEERPKRKTKAPTYMEDYVRIG